MTINYTNRFSEDITIVSNVIHTSATAANFYISLGFTLESGEQEVKEVLSYSVFDYGHMIEYQEIGE